MLVLWYYKTCVLLCALNALNNRHDQVALLGWTLLAFAFMGMYFRYAKEA